VGKIACYKYFYTKDQSVTFDLSDSVVAQEDGLPSSPAKVLLGGKG